ncbi:MAG: transketolase C-terminal domain-containing protein [Chloroflexota bacterium]
MKKDKPKTVLESLNLALHHAMADDGRVLLIGEDILDPYGGAFKVTRGLSTAYPDRVLTSPISEAGITGIAGGMALRGLKPVVEIMFGDFISLSADQLINHIAKYRYMYNEQVRTPVVIRTPMGGRRGYGPTHSQTLEKHFLGLPGLRTLAPFHLLGKDPLGAPGKLLYDAILNSEDPVLFIENKLQYLFPLLSQDALFDYTFEEVSRIYNLSTPFYKLSICSAPPAKVTMITYGYMAHLAFQAQHQLAYEKEIFTELLIPTQLAPFELSPLFDSLRRTGRLLTIEEGAGALGWGAEVLSQAVEVLGSELKKAKRLCAEGHAVPAARQLEEASLPNLTDILNAVQKMV